MVKNIASVFMWKLIYFEKLWLTSGRREGEGVKKYKYTRVEKIKGSKPEGGRRIRNGRKIFRKTQI